MSEQEDIIKDQTDFLRFLKSRFRLFHRSNFFFRDLHYGVIMYLRAHGRKSRYADAERIAREVGLAFEKIGIFNRIDHQTWLVNYPEFALPKVQKEQKRLA